MSAPALRVERPHPKGAGWRVVHHSGLDMGFRLRLRRHAEAAMAELLATGADFSRSADALRKDRSLRSAREVSWGWRQRSDQCCDGKGEHYSPYTYRLPSGRCSGRASGDRSALPVPAGGRKRRRSR